MTHSSSKYPFHGGACGCQSILLNTVLDLLGHDITMLHAAQVNTFTAGRTTIPGVKMKRNGARFGRRSGPKFKKLKRKLRQNWVNSPRRCYFQFLYVNRGFHGESMDNLWIIYCI